MDIKKDRWTEEELLALPSGESDKFDRKSGALLMINGLSDVHNDFSIFWKTYRDEFLNIYEIGSKEKEAFEESRNNVTEIVKILIGEIKQERNYLCTKHKIPFDEPEPLLVQQIEYGGFR